MTRLFRSRARFATALLWLFILALPTGRGRTSCYHCERKQPQIGHNPPSCCGHF